VITVGTTGTEAIRSTDRIAAWNIEQWASAPIRACLGDLLSVIEVAGLLVGQESIVERVENVGFE